MSTSLVLIGFFLAALVLAILVVLLIRNQRRLTLLQTQFQEKEELLRQTGQLLSDTQAAVELLEQQQTLDEPAGIIKSRVELTLKKALKRSEEQNFQKNSFLSNLSSEIRTPLNNIVGFASLLENEISLLENKELFEYARAISESGDRLISLLNNIIDISKIETYDIELNVRPCPLSPIISSIAQFYVFKANEKKIKFNIIHKDGPDAMADDKILTHVVGSIVDNAIKYTSKGFVNLSNEYNPETQTVTIRVRDSGSGIDPGYLTEIFNPFRRESPGYSKEEQGTRLGLPIAKRFMEMMNGSLEIESEKGNGTTVTMSLQAIAVESGVSPEHRQEVKSMRDGKASKPAPKPESKHIDTKKIHLLQDLEIFIVEDDLMNSMVLVQMTKSLGKVTTAVNGEVTLKIISDLASQGKTFDIMLFDINLPPPYDGVKLMQQIRKVFPEYRDIPFVAQTAYAMTGDREKLLEAGFDDYIAKPINKNELYTIIKHQLDIRKV